MDGSVEINHRTAMMRRAIILLAAVMLLPTVAKAQADDFGMWYSLTAEKKLSKKWSIDVEGDFRTRNDSKTADRWSIGLDAEYKIAKWLKASAGYTLLYDNNPEKITYDDDGEYKKWRPSYWGLRHRFAVSLAASVDYGRFSFTLRERWQYTYRPEKTTERYDFSDAQWESKAVKGKGRNVLRSKLKVDYNIPKCKVDPYVDVELFNAWALQKVRYTVGVDWKLTKKHIFGLTYHYQDVNADDDDNDVDSHIIGLSYKFKF